jgi:hypothetical protein
MNFQFGSKSTTNIPFSVISRNTSSKNIQMGNFSKIAKIVNQNRVNNVPITASSAVAPIQPDQPKKMKWGEPVWLLLHTLSEKVKPDSFSEIRQGFLNIIYIICTNLPCPDCSAHAKTYLDGNNFMSIQSKEQLKQFMFDFHNSVNIRKGFTIFKYQDLQKYSTAITINIIYNFMNSYNVKNHSIHMISNDVYRNRMIETIKTWFNQNINNFDK